MEGQIEDQCVDTGHVGRFGADRFDFHSAVPPVGAIPAVAAIGPIGTVACALAAGVVGLVII